jgi:hypothetical protein
MLICLPLFRVIVGCWLGRHGLANVRVQEQCLEWEVLVQWLACGLYWFSAYTGHMEVYWWLSIANTAATAVEVPAGRWLNTHPVAIGLCGQHGGLIALNLQRPWIFWQPGSAEIDKISLKHSEDLPTCLCSVVNPSNSQSPVRHHHGISTTIPPPLPPSPILLHPSKCLRSFGGES